MKHFPLDKNYAALLKSYGISADELLKRAQLPLDMFVRNNNTAYIWSVLQRKCQRVYETDCSV